MNKFDIEKFFKKENVLDKGYVELVDGMVSDPMLKIVNSARVSFLKETTELSEKDKKLILYLINHEHFSTLRHSYFSFKVKAPLCVFRQWWKYQIGSEWQEGAEAGTIKLPETNWNEACLIGETFVYAKLHDTIRFFTMSELYEHKVSNNGFFKELVVCSYSEKKGLFVGNKIKDVIDRGIQDVFEIKFANGNKIICTLNHKFLTKDNGWQTIKDAILLAINEDKTVKSFDTKQLFIIGDCNAFINKFSKPKYSNVVEVVYKGKNQCYDLEMNDPHKNFMANGIIVHNSGRYVEFKPEFYIPEHIRIQSKDNKQGSHGKLENISDTDINPVSFFKASCMRQYDDYNTLVKSGAAKEQARMLLPQNIYSECIWTCSLQTILFFLHQRLKPDAQFEIREYATAVHNLIKPFIIGEMIKE